MQRASKNPERSRLNVLPAIVAMVVISAVLVWAAPLARSGPGTEDANPNAGAGSAVVHYDAGNVNRPSP